MYRLLVLSILIWVSEAGLVRVPKIYNALITSDEDLSPSQAFPVLEPVLRTTALGVAFPPLVIPSPIHNHGPIFIKEENTKSRVKEETTTDSIELSEELMKKKPARKQKPQVPSLSYHGSLYPLTFDPYVPYGYHPDFFYPAPAFPFYQHPVYIDVEQFDNKKPEKTSPAQLNRHVVNFKSNPDIPDVIPPLPRKIERKLKA